MNKCPISTSWRFAPLWLLTAGALMLQMAFAQPPPPWPPPPPPDAGYPSEPPPPPAPDAESATLPPLDQLLAPIALYPDPLISLILPASTFPDQVQDAATFAQSGGDPSQVGSMGWDSSVQGLAHYPSVAEWMGANFTWTQQLGGAFANQPAAVMDAIQDLRRRAQAAGTLVTNAQQQVVVYGDSLEIMPQQPEVIYVPQYDPAVVYVEQPYGYYPGPLLLGASPIPQVLGCRLISTGSAMRCGRAIGINIECSTEDGAGRSTLPNST